MAVCICELTVHCNLAKGSRNCISIYLPSTLFSVLLLSSSLLLFFPLTDAKVVINYEKKSHRELTLHVGEVITDVKLVCVWRNQHIDVKIFHLTQAKNVCFSGIKLLMQHSVQNLNTGQDKLQSRKPQNNIFSERKQTQVGMEPSKTKQTRWELHHITFTPSLLITVSYLSTCSVELLGA